MIKINNLFKTLVLLFSFIVIACGGSDDEPSNPTPTPDPIPEATILIEPLNNTDCNQGEIISDKNSNVLFEWNKALNTTKYTLSIKNLNTNKVEEKTTAETSLTVTLLRGTPYSWNVVSINSTKVTKISNTWKFFNAGKGTENYTPFPAELVSPEMGSLSNTTVTLKWNGSDIDEDIESYNVYLGTNPTPTKLLKTTVNDSISEVILNSDTLYYWMVVTKDSQGNTSNSEVFEFRTN
ncbi:hypothetical protein [Lutibacter citreus]|uniref:hypothetical protein n=1 Tax=Lutibacter citreus TaxID=2138210 RepID=UPI000DBE66E8|nr:hypothetical protein [Lutibacter citreus]